MKEAVAREILGQDDPEEEISDTSSFSTMKQKFYYANKILALQKKVAEQVVRY